MWESSKNFFSFPLKEKTRNIALPTILARFNFNQTIDLIDNKSFHNSLNRSKLVLMLTTYNRLYVRS